MVRANSHTPCASGQPGTSFCVWSGHLYSEARLSGSQEEASSPASETPSCHWTLLGQEPGCQGQEEEVLRLELVHRRRKMVTVLVQMEMAVVQVCSSSESTEEQKGSFPALAGRRASWACAEALGLR